MATALDFSARYRLSPDLAVVRRNGTTIQIGTEAPRRVILAHVPPHAHDVLMHLGDAECLADAIERLGGDARHWRQLFHRLSADKLLEPADRTGPFQPHLTGEWMTLIHRLGRAGADRVLQARADATVVIEGAGLVADIVGAVLDSAGIGAVYQWPGPGAAGGGGADPREHAGADGRVARRVRYHRPASQIRPTVVVLAGSLAPAAGRTAALVSAVVPHLPVHVTSARLVVGPLVLPGRSACTNCIDRHRRDADPEWSAIDAAAPLRPSALLAHAAATLAATQVLDLVDTVRRPDAIGATIEQAAGSSYPQRRVWSVHDACRCRQIAGIHPPAELPAAAPAADPASFGPPAAGPKDARAARDAPGDAVRV
jgi:hypothetical protein